MAGPATKRAPAKRVVTTTASSTSRPSCCALCDIQIGKDDDIPVANKKERHSLIPASQRERTGVTETRTIKVCALCKRVVHAYFTDEELADHLSTLEALKSALEDVGWFEKRPMHPLKNKRYTSLTVITDEVKSYKRRRFRRSSSSKDKSEKARKADQALQASQERMLQEMRAKMKKEMEKQLEKQLEKQMADMQARLLSKPSTSSSGARSKAERDSSDDDSSSSDSSLARPITKRRRTEIEDSAPSERPIRAKILEKPRYKCNVPKCGVGFSRLKDLQEHSQSTHGSEVFPCCFPGCTKIYTRRGNLGQHFKTAHAGWTCKDGVWLPPTQSSNTPTDVTSAREDSDSEEITAEPSRQISKHSDRRPRVQESVRSNNSGTDSSASDSGASDHSDAGGGSLNAPRTKPNLFNEASSDIEIDNSTSDKSRVKPAIELSDSEDEHDSAVQRTDGDKVETDDGAKDARRRSSSNPQLIARQAIGSDPMQHRAPAQLHRTRPRNTQLDAALSDNRCSETLPTGPQVPVIRCSTRPQAVQQRPKSPELQSVAGFDRWSTWSDAPFVDYDSNLAVQTVPSARELIYYFGKLLDDDQKIWMKGIKQPVPAYCRTIGQYLEPCLRPNARGREQGAAVEFDIFAGALCKIQAVLSEFLNSVSKYAVFIWLTSTHFTSLHWRAWALTDLRNPPKAFSFKPPTSQEMKAFGEWDAARKVKLATQNEFVREREVARKLDRCYPLRLSYYPLVLRPYT